MTSCVRSDVLADPMPAPGTAPSSTLDLRLLVPAVVAWLTACVVVRLSPVSATASALTCLGLAGVGLAVARHTAGRRMSPRSAAVETGAWQVGDVRRRTPTASSRTGTGRRRSRSGASSTGIGARRTGSYGDRLPAVLASGGLALVVAAAVLGAGAAQVAARSRGPLAAVASAEEPSTVTVSGSVAERATLLAPSWPGAPPRARVVLEVDAVEQGRRSPAATPEPASDPASDPVSDPASDGAARGVGGQPVVVLGPAAWTGVEVGARVAVTGRAVVAPPGDRATALLTTTDVPRPLAPPPPWLAAAGSVRQVVVRQAAMLPGDAAALLPGVTVGDTSGVPDDLRDAMRASGLAHLTAVSGAHFALLTTLVLAGAATARLPRLLRAGAVVAVGAGLVLVVGPSPSVLRAAVMGLVGAAALLVGRRSRSPAALAAAVVVLLLVDPWLATELGFVLSVAATAGLVLLGVPLAERWRGALPHTVATALAAPVAAQVVCAPALLAASPAVALLAVPANLVAAPAVAPATVLGLAGALVGSWWPALGHVLAHLAGAACWWIGAVARTAAGVPGTQVAWAPGLLGMLLLAAAGTATARLLWPGRPARRRTGWGSG